MTTYFEYAVLALTGACLVTATAMAFVVIREDRRLKREAKLAEIVATALEKGRQATQTGEILAITTPFIQDNVKTTTFGDKRRLTAPLTDLIRPETGPIDLPDEHVPVIPPGIGVPK